MQTGAAGRPIEGTSASGAWRLALLGAALYAGLAGWFASLQNVWIDESTQLLGSTLPLNRLFAWLAGHPEPLGVPGDRMPPVSYLIDWSCGRTLCATVGAYRALHLLAAAAGVAMVVGLAARRYGTAAAFVAGVLLLTPQAVTLGGEVRAYPLFLAVTALQLVLFYRLFDGGELPLPRLVAFAAAGLLAIYIHFFGLVSTSALFVGLLAARARRGREIVWIAGAWVAVLVLSAGILPFVGGARTVSDASPPDASPAAVAAYLLRVPGHASMLLAPWATALFFLSLALLIAMAVWGAARRIAAAPLAMAADPVAGVLVAAAAGLAVTIGAALVAHGFDPLKPSYSVWLLPLLAVIAAAAVRPGAAFRVRAAIGGVLAASLLAGSLPLLRHGAWFVHGPERAIDGEIGDAVAETAVVHVGPGWAYAYYPLVRDHGRALAQFWLDDAGQLHPIGWGGDPQPAPVLPEVLHRYRRLLIAGVTLRSARDIARPLAAPPPEMLALPPGEWHAAAAFTRPGLYALGLTRLERIVPR